MKKNPYQIFVNKERWDSAGFPCSGKEALRFPNFTGQTGIPGKGTMFVLAFENTLTQIHKHVGYVYFSFGNLPFITSNIHL